MSEPIDLDAVASALLDNELDAVERDKAESNPAVMARVAEFRAIAEKLRSPVAIDGHRRDAAIQHALGHLRPVRSRQGLMSRIRGLQLRPRALVWGPIGLAAAALAAVAVVSLEGGKRGNDTAADSASNAATELTAAATTIVAGGPFDAAINADTGISGGATTIAAGAEAPNGVRVTDPITNIGEVDNADELRQLLAKIDAPAFASIESDQSSSPSTSSTAAASRSTVAVPTADKIPTQNEACLSVGTVVARVTWQGVDALVVRMVDGTVVVVAADPGAPCRELARLGPG